MNNEKTNLQNSIPSWLALSALFVVFYLMYAPSFTFDYLMNDELYNVGLDRNPLRHAIGQFFFSGRYLWGIFNALVFNYAGYDTIKIQFVRFLNFASLAAIALLLFRFLYQQSKNIYLSFFTILFFVSQLSFQWLAGYSFRFVSISQPSMWLSLCAFYLHFYFFPKHKIQKWIGYGSVFSIFMIAMQSSQTFAYFAMVPLSFLALTEGKQRKRQIFEFFVLAIISFVLSVFLYKLIMEIGPERGFMIYATYWSAFEVWTYPYPFHYTFPLGAFKKIAAKAVMGLWFVTGLSAMLTEFSACKKGERIQVMLKWFWALMCLGFGALMIIAESPLKVAWVRPHMTMIFVGVCIFIGAYAIQTLSSRCTMLRTNVSKGLGAFLIIFMAFGAQSGLSRGLVDSRQDQLDFIRTELFSKWPSQYEKIVVVASSQPSVCMTEPCSGKMGSVINSKYHETSEGRYRYALNTLGIAPESKDILFLDRYPKQVADNELVIDWGKFVKARRRHRDYLRQRNQPKQ